MSEDDLEALRAATETGTRAEGAGVREQDRVEDLVAALDAVADDPNGNMIGVRDTTMAALLDVVADDDALREELVDDLEATLDAGVDRPAEPSDLHRLLLHAGVRAAAPNLYEDLQDARAERARHSF